MGVAGNGLLECFPECRDKFSESVYRFINDRIKCGPLRIVLRQVAAEFFAWKHRGRVLIFSSHQGPLLRHGQCVVIIYDFIVLHHPFQSRMQVMGFLFLLPRILKNSSTVVAISNHVREDALSYLPWMRQKGICVIPSISTRLDSFKKGGEDWQARLKEGRLLFVGANYLHKRLDVAIEAVIELRRKGWEIGLDIVGVSEPIWEEAYGINFEALKDHGILARHYVSDAELENLYSKAVILLFLSETEGLGLPPLEAMRKNCPVLCNDTAELRDTCRDAAFFVDITQKSAVAEILEQLMSGKLMTEMNRKILLGNERSMQFERSNIVPQWLNLIQALERL
jgi:glycosyltransferase involved in cell wall biosynthesis